MNNSADSRSPFAELSFSQQQEMWRMWRSQALEYQPVKEPPAAPEPAPKPEPPLPQRYLPPTHKNLDQVHARISAASARAGAFKPLTSRE